MVKSQPDTKTSPGTIAIRNLLTIIPLLYKNIRVSRQGIFPARVLRGPGTIDEDLFRFDLFSLFVREGIWKNPNPFLLLRFFAVSDDLDVIRVVDDPRFTGNFRDIKGSSKLSGLRYSRAFFSARLC